MRERIHGATEAVAPNDVIVFSTVRNEIKRLPFFLAYYRALGVDLFVFIDNASDDGTTDYLKAQLDVVVIWTDESYKDSRAGELWLNEALDAYGTGHWCLTVDSDELFVFHAIEVADLKVLCAHLDSRGDQAVFTVVLDCYGDQKPGIVTYQAGRSFLETCPYFDGDGYFTEVNDSFPYYSVFGGMRRRVFFDNGQLGWGPALRKLPLVKWHPGMAYAHSTQSSTPCRLSDISGVLLHFKFLDDFGALAKAEVARGDRFIPSDHARYAQTLDTNAKTFMYTDSVPFVDSSQLVRCHLLRTTAAWLDELHDTIALVDSKRVAGEVLGPYRDSLLCIDVHKGKRLSDTLSSFLDLVSAPRREACT